MTKRFTAAFVATALLLTPTVAIASTLPKADFGGSPTLGLGIGLGAAVSVDVPVSSRFSVGAAFYSYNFAINGLEGRLLYKLTSIERLQLDLLGGLEAHGPGGNLGVGPFIGLAAALPITDRLTGRLNIGVTPLNVNYLGAMGGELGYKFTPRLEGTFGFSGHGDLIGIKYYL